MPYANNLEEEIDELRAERDVLRAVLYPTSDVGIDSARAYYQDWRKCRLGVDSVFSNDESAILRFLSICQQSLSPHQYEVAVKVCLDLGKVRKGLDASSVDKCLNALREEEPVNG